MNTPPPLSTDPVGPRYRNVFVSVFWVVEIRFGIPFCSALIFRIIVMLLLKYRLLNSVLRFGLPLNLYLEHSYLNIGDFMVGRLPIHVPQSLVMKTYVWVPTLLQSVTTLAIHTFYISLVMLHPWMQLVRFRSNLNSTNV